MDMAACASDEGVDIDAWQSFMLRTRHDADIGRPRILLCPASHAARLPV